MKNIMLSLLLSAFCAAGASAQVNFDAGVDTKGFAEQARNSDLPRPKASYGTSHYTRDCASFSFGPADGNLLSERVRLRSQEYIRECYTEYIRECYTTYKPGPNGTQIPVQTCYMRPYQRCYDRPGMSWSETAQVKVLARRLLPWERESFEVCLEGPRSNLYVNDAGFKYTVSRQGNYDSLFELAPQYKVPMKADENGLNYVALTYDSARKAYKFEVSDRWAAEYAGDKVQIDVDLYKDNPNWFDGYKGSRKFTLDAAVGYAMTFTEKDLETEDRKAVEPEDDTKGAKKYYLKWGFRRLGKVSKDNHVKKGETPRVAVN